MRREFSLDDKRLIGRLGVVLRSGRCLCGQVMVTWFRGVGSLSDDFGGKLAGSVSDEARFSPGMFQQFRYDSSMSRNHS